MIGESSEIIPQGSTHQKDVEMATLFKFYVLIDPRDNLIKYVGRTVNEKDRLRNHIYESKKQNKTKKERWIVALLRRNMQPILKVIYTQLCTLQDAIAIERMLVKKIGKRFSLKNAADNYLGAVLTGKVVYQYTLSGEYVATYANAHQAMLQTGIHDANISLTCRGLRISAGDYMWSYTQGSCVYSKKDSSKVIYQFSREKILVGYYKNARLAEKATGVSYKKISAVANNRQSTAGSFIWSFNNKI